MEMTNVAVSAKNTLELMCADAPPAVRDTVVAVGGRVEEQFRRVDIAGNSGARIPGIA